MDWVCSHSKERKYKKTFAREKHGCYPLISSNRPCQNSTGATFSEQNLKKQAWQRLWQKSLFWSMVNAHLNWDHLQRKVERLFGELIKIKSKQNFLVCDLLKVRKRNVGWGKLYCTTFSKFGKNCSHIRFNSWERMWCERWFWDLRQASPLLLLHLLHLLLFLLLLQSFHLKIHLLEIAGARRRPLLWDCFEKNPKHSCYIARLSFSQIKSWVALYSLVRPVPYRWHLHLSPLYNALV